MIKDKWLKVGVAALMSIMVLAGCGNSDEPQMEQENQTPGEEEDNSYREGIEDEDDPDESDEETEEDATTDSLDEDDSDSDED